MRVVHVAPTPFGREGLFGGGERYPLELARALAAEVDCELVTFGQHPRLVIDPDGVHDPRLMNDRLLLGLKGTMSEYELGLLRQRGLAARDGKAGRGALRFTLPPGLVWGEDGRIDARKLAEVAETVAGFVQHAEHVGEQRPRDAAAAYVGAHDEQDDPRLTGQRRQAEEPEVLTGRGGDRVLRSRTPLRHQ